MVEGAEVNCERIICSYVNTPTFTTSLRGEAGGDQRDSLFSGGSLTAECSLQK